MRSRFSVHPLLHREGEAMITQDGEHLVTCDNVLAANLLAELLEKAAHVAECVGHLIGGGDEDLGRRRIAHAVAKSMGERLDLRPEPRLPGIAGADRHSSCAERLL